MTPIPATMNSLDQMTLAFEEETRRAEQAAEEHREHIVNELLHHRANNHMDEVAAQEDTDKQSVEHTDDSSKQ